MIFNPLNQRLLWIVFIIVYICKIENANYLHLGFLYMTFIIICWEELVSCKNLFTILYLIYFNRICSNKRNASVNELFTFIWRIAADNGLIDLHDKGQMRSVWQYYAYIFSSLREQPLKKKKTLQNCSCGHHIDKIISKLYFPFYIFPYCSTFNIRKIRTS